MTSCSKIDLAPVSLNTFHISGPGDVFSIYVVYLPKLRVQVRRTDKLRRGRDAVFHPIDEYMQYVEEWYQQQQKQGINVTQKRVYLATDDPMLLAEATKKYVL